MEKLRDYGGFIVWFIGLGYLAGWAMAPERLATMPASVHAIGLTALAFLPWRVWVWWNGRRLAHPTPTAEPDVTPPPPAPIRHRRPAPPPKQNVKPRTQFGLRGVPH